MSYDGLEISPRSGEPIELYRFTTGSRSWYLTSGDAKVTHLTDTYSPEAVSRSAVKEGSEPDAGSVTVSLPRTHPIAALFIGYVPEPPLSLQILGRHRSDTGTFEIFRGQAGTGNLAGPRIEIQCLPDIAADDQLIPRNRCQAQCNWALYSPQCGISKPDYFVAGPVAVVSGATVTATAFGGKPTGWLNNGYLERANGERRWIVGHVGTVVTLLSPFLDLVAGELVIAQAGCDRTEAVCASKFNNHARFLGFPYLPMKNPFDVGVT